MHLKVSFLDIVDLFHKQNLKKKKELVWQSIFSGFDIGF